MKGHLERNASLAAKGAYVVVAGITEVGPFFLNRRFMEP